jgi:hypothetical protein
MGDWTNAAETPPPPGVVVDTKIDDQGGLRNEQPLKQMAGSRLWWFPDGSMYVYYTPTHWRYRKESQ